MIEASTLQPDGADPREAFEAALDWWREAGVDYCYGDEPRGWLKEAEPEAAAPPPPPPAPPAPPRRSPLERALAAVPEDSEVIGGARHDWPQSLDAFNAWWLSELSLTEAGSTRRTPPRGAANARLMVLIDQPAAGDDATLLSGEDGKFLSAMLRAMEIAEDDVYFASALPAAAALPQWDALAARGLAEITRHHITLAAPQRILVLERALAPLFGISPDAARDPVMLDVGNGSIPLLLAADLAQLARSPIRRRNFWNRWLEWTR